MASIPWYSRSRPQGEFEPFDRVPHPDGIQYHGRRGRREQGVRPAGRGRNHPLHLGRVAPGGRGDPDREPLGVGPVLVQPVVQLHHWFLPLAHLPRTRSSAASRSASPANSIAFSVVRDRSAIVFALSVAVAIGSAGTAAT